MGIVDPVNAMEELDKDLKDKDTLGKDGKVAPLEPTADPEKEEEEAGAKPFSAVSLIKLTFGQIHDFFTGGKK
jgi:hypothetical protein